jgi:surface carbohydrate biosynthesis protein
MRIYYEIETVKRELDARILFGIISANKGFSVVIGKKNRLLEKIKYLMPGVFIFKSSKERPNKLAQYLRKYGFYIFSSDEEGLFNISSDEVLHRVPEKTIKTVDKFLAWGDEQANPLRNNYSNIDDKIILCGNSRFDLLKKPIKNVYLEAAKNINKKYGKFDLYISAFHKYNALTEPGTNYLTGVKSWGDNPIEHEKRKKLFSNMFELQKKNMMSTINFFNSNSKKMNKMIIRPHPSENLLTWTNNLNEDLKENVIYDHINTNSWIMAADRVFGYYCTSTIEAGLLGKMAVNLVFNKGEVYETKIFDLFCNEINNPINYEDLDLKIKNLEIKSSKDFVNDKASFFFKNDKFYNAELVCNEITKFTKNKKKQNVKDRFDNKIYFAFFLILQKIRNLFINTKSITAKLYNQKNPGITLSEVKNKLNDFSKELGISNIECREIYPGVFEIKKMKNDDLN